VTRTRMVWRTAAARIRRRVAVVVTVALGLDTGAVIARTFHAGTLTRGAWPTWALLALWCPLAFLAAALVVTVASRAVGAARRALRRGMRDGG